MITRSFAIIVLGFLLIAKAHSQQMPIYGQYIFNNTVINPAQAGAGKEDLFGILARYQWLGIQGAPMTHAVYLNTRLPSNLGFSASIYNDLIGPISDVTVQADLAYRARLSENFFLSFGVRAMASYIYFDMLGLQDIADPNDPNFIENYSSGIQLNTGAGILAYNKTFFLGVSMPKILARSISANASDPSLNPESIYTVSRSLIAYAGNTFTLLGHWQKEKLEFTPSVLLKVTESAPTQLDVNGIFTYRNTFIFGPMLRTSFSAQNGTFDAIGFLIGLQVSENWNLGYMYELPTNDLKLSTKQTHEVSLRYSWGKVKEKIGTARCFF